jgi:hypothetical protein
MTLADQAVIGGHDGRVTEGQPGRPKRRTFTAAYKARILAEFLAQAGTSQRGTAGRADRNQGHAQPGGEERLNATPPALPRRCGQH